MCVVGEVCLKSCDDGNMEKVIGWELGKESIERASKGFQFSLMNNVEGSSIIIP